MGGKPLSPQRKAELNKISINEAKLSKEVKALELPPDIPKNCIFFIFILRQLTDRLFGKGTYPLDIINNIVILNAWMGEFKGICETCFQWHINGAPNTYHPGKWKHLTYDDILNRGFVIDLFYQGQFGHYLLKSGQRASHNLVHDTTKSYGAMLKVGCKVISKGTDFSSAVWDKAGILVGLPCMMVAQMTTPFIALGIWTGGLVVAPVLGAAHAIATPFIDTGKVIASDVAPESFPMKYDNLLDSWSCCRAEGSWAPPCQTCYGLPKREKKDGKSKGDDHSGIHISYGSMSDNEI